MIFALTFLWPFLRKGLLSLKNKNLIIPVILFLVIAAFYPKSTTFFRLKLADYYISTRDYDEAISLYKKALRKENIVLAHRPLESISKINFLKSLLTNTYFNSAEYHLKLADYYSERDTSDPERLDNAMVEYEKIPRLYEDYQQTIQPIAENIDNKWAEILQKSNQQKVEGLFRFGKVYVEKELWQEAKYFFTQSILKYLNPAVVLEKLDALYNKNKYSEIKRKIWGKRIFVTLEDFEDFSKPVLTNWASSAEPAIKNHTISGDYSLTGNFSEYFDLSYQKSGYDYWVKPVNIPLNNPGLILGVRSFIRSKDPFKGYLKINILYPRQGNTGVWQLDIKKDAGGGWEERRIDNLYEKAKIIALEQNWTSDEMMIDKIIVDTQGISNKFYIDNIQLYVIE